MKILTKKGNRNTNICAKRLMAAAATVGMMVSMASPAWAATYYLKNGSITVEGFADGNYVTQDSTTVRDDGEIIIKQNEQGDSTSATANTITIVSKNEEAPDEEKYTDAEDKTDETAGEK